MIFRQLFDSVSGTYSYLIASRKGAEALIIDPVLEKVDRYIQLMNELDLRLVKAVDTHLHADHVTGLGALRDRTRCITVMGENTKADVVSMRLADGDRLDIEGVSLDVIYTPGHTDDSYSFTHGRPGLHRRHAADPRHRPDRFPERRPARAIRSIFNRLLKLPDETLVYPGARLQGRHGQHHRRGAALQSAAAGQIGGRVRRDDEQPEPAQPEDDGRGGAGQHADRPRPGRRRQEGLGGSRRRRHGDARRQPEIVLVDLRESRERERHGAIPGALHEPYREARRTISAPAACFRTLGGRASDRLLLRLWRALGHGGSGGGGRGDGFGRHIQGGLAAWQAAGGPLEK